jgi:hypothetical protein
MKMSCCRAGLERGSVTQHRPHHVDPPTRQRDESLSVPLALGVRQLNKDLERRVAERTEQLKSAMAKQQQEAQERQRIEQ